jgi:hypothetical protein
MPSGRVSQKTIVLSEAERHELEAWLRSTTQKAGLVRRARIVLLRAQGMPLACIGREVGIRRRHVEKWVDRFRAERLDGLADRKGRGRKPFFPSGRRGPSGQDRVRAA